MVAHAHRAAVATRAEALHVLRAALVRIWPAAVSAWPASVGGLRRASSTHLRSTLHAVAFSMVGHSPGAQAYYRRRRAAGDAHATALRKLGCKILLCLHHCMASGVPYDDAVAFGYDPAATDAPTLQQKSRSGAPAYGVTAGCCRLGEGLVEVLVDEGRRAGDDDQHAAVTDRGLLHHGVAPIGGKGEELTPALVSEPGAIIFCVVTSTFVLPTRTWYCGQPVMASKIRPVPVESFPAVSL